MLIKKVVVTNKIKAVLVMVFLCLISIPLRFKDLGYSDYIGDEHKAFIELERGESISHFFLTRRKGPMQFLVSEIPHIITGDFRNEYAQRFPFALVSVAAVVTFYFLIRKMVRDEIAALVSAFLLLVNGFIVGFGRIAQYQNLNLLFGFLALYFYTDLLHNNKKLIRSSLFGTLFFSLSLLSHWDAIFILPVMCYIFTKFLRNNSFTKNYKTRLIIYNLMLGSLALLPFLIPYIFTFSGSLGNRDYFTRRIEMGYNNRQLYLELIKLYNPFLFLEFVAAAAFLGFLKLKKSLPFILWFLFSFLVFEIFVRKPGTHIYNFVLPALVLSGIAISEFVRLTPRVIRWLPGLGFILVGAFLYYQSYFLFVDHSREYPWEEKELFSDLREKYKHEPTTGLINKLPRLTTQKYSINQKLPLFGFPHYRHWNEINQFITEQNILLNENYGYITNEDKTISEWYIDTKYRVDKVFYIVVVKKPINFVPDSSYPQYPRKNEVTRFYNNGAWVVKIYKVYRKPGV